MEGVGDAAMEAFTSAVVPQLHTARYRKQKITSMLSDSGFEEDLSSTPSPVRCAVSPLRAHTPVTCMRDLANWHHHYADIGYKIQKGKETHFRSFKCLARQSQVTPEARCKLVSWLIPVHKYFHLSFECCCLAVNIMDRFLASTPVASDCFQLLGVTALLLASKQVEVSSPGISQLLSMCCNAFTKEQLCNLECLVLLRLNYRLAAPTHAFFLDYYTHCSMAAHTTTIEGSVWGGHHQDARKPWQRSSLAQIICELTLADYAFNKYPPSLTTSCALSMAEELLSQPPETTVHSERVVRSQEDEEGHKCIELSSNKRSLPASASAQVVDRHRLQIGSVSVEHHSLQAVVQDSHSHSLAQECRENLKLLVSLNQEMLQVTEMT